MNKNFTCSYQYKKQSSFLHWLDWNSVGIEVHSKAAHGQLPSNFQIYGGHHIKYQDIHILSLCSSPDEEKNKQN